MKAGACFLVVTPRDERFVKTKPAGTEQAIDLFASARRITVGARECHEQLVETQLRARGKALRAATLEISAQRMLQLLGGAEARVRPRVHGARADARQLRGHRRRQR